MLLWVFQKKVTEMKHLEPCWMGDTRTRVGPKSTQVSFQPLPPLSMGVSLLPGSLVFVQMRGLYVKMQVPPSSQGRSSSCRMLRCSVHYVKGQWTLARQGETSKRLPRSWNCKSLSPNMTRQSIRTPKKFRRCWNTGAVDWVVRTRGLLERREAGQLRSTGDNREGEVLDEESQAGRQAGRSARGQRLARDTFKVVRETGENRAENDAYAQATVHETTRLGDGRRWYRTRNHWDRYCHQCTWSTKGNLRAFVSSTTSVIAP